MSKTILADVDGFTPVIDDLVKELGITPALVFGRVWRFCQMDLRVCTASQTTIAQDLELSRETVNRSLKQLVEKGYLVESDKAGVTKTYQDTGKAGLNLQLTAGTCDRRSQPKTKSAAPVIVDHNPVINDHNPCDLKSQPPVIVDHTKIDSLRKNPREKARDLSASSEIFDNPEDVLEGLKTQIKIQGQLDRTNFRRMILPLTAAGWVDHTLRIVTDNEPNKLWLSTRGIYLFKQALVGLTGRNDLAVEFKLPEEVPA